MKMNTDTKMDMDMNMNMNTDMNPIVQHVPDPIDSVKDYSLL